MRLPASISFEMFDNSGGLGEGFSCRSAEAPKAYNMSMFHQGVCNIDSRISCRELVHIVKLNVGRRGSQEGMRLASVACTVHT
jgi:hypothetical protein